MASSNSRRNNGDQVVVEEEDDVEYEEIEEEIEEEEFEEVEEEIEEEEEEEEPEEEEEEKEAEEEEEEEEEVEEEEEPEEVEEEAEEKEEEVEYEEVEEEEYEEIEVEVEEEVTDEEEEGDATMAEVKGDSNQVAAKSSSSVPMVADNEDGGINVKSRDEVCLGSGHTSAMKSEAGIITLSHVPETFCDGGGSSACELQNEDGKSRGDSCLRFGHESAIKSEARILNGSPASESIWTDGGSLSLDRVVRSSVSPKLFEHIPGTSNDGGDSVKDNQSDVDREILVSSEKHVPAPDDGTERLARTTDDEVFKALSEEPDFASQRRNKEKKDSRSCFPQVRPRSLSPGAECEDSNKRAAISCEYFARGWCIKGSSCRFLHKMDHANATQVAGDIIPTSELQHGKGSGHDVDALESLAYQSKSTTVKDILKDHGEDLKKLHRREDMDKTPMLERKFSSSRVSVDSPKSSSYKDRVRSISKPREVETDTFRENHSSDGLPVIEGGSMLRHNFFSRHGSSLSDFGVPTGSDSILRLVEESAAMRRRYSLDLQNSVPSCYNSSYKGTSVRHNSPLYSRSDSNKFSDRSYAQELHTYVTYKRTFTPYSWVPSVPFRSAFIPTVNKPSDIQYDPFRDSIEEPDAGHASFKQSSYGQTQNVQSLSGQNPLEFQKGLQIDNWDKSYSGNDKAIPAVESESAATSASDAQNRKITEEENPMVPGSVKAILKANKGINDGNFKLDSGLKVETGRHHNELDDEESKAIRFFRAALIEFVKELMKPIWHEGRLSKDVYKVIVQKAEDKILSTLQPSQVPNTSESVKQYLSSSRPKILKLIQAYVDKYGRF